MKRFKAGLKPLIISAAIVMAILAGGLKAIGADTITPLNFNPQVQIPVTGLNQENIPVGSYDPYTQTMSSNLLAKYVAGFYNYGMMIAGILAAIVLMGGGLLWLTSGGNDSRIGQAKEMISGSIAGTVILFCSWVILNTINPALLEMKPIQTSNIGEVQTVCCQYSDRAEISTKDACQEKNGQVFSSKTDVAGKISFYTPDPNGKKCSIPGCCIARENGLPDGKIARCSNTLYSNCFSPYFFWESNCSLVPAETGTDASGNAYTRSCQGMSDNCSEAKDGDACFDTGGSLTGYCYSKVCWLYDGTVGEPCGNEPFSKCDPDLPQDGDKCNEDWGSRRCSDSTCCKFNSSGQRIN